MIDYIRGILTDREVTYVTVEAGGVGYEIAVPLTTLEKLPSLATEIKLYTHYQIREDAHKLFGFLTKNEREVFRQLIAVNQIGPRIAMSILSKISIDELVRSVVMADPSRLVKVPGVGAKTAQRIVLELKGKLKDVSQVVASPASGESAALDYRSLSTVGDEAFEALVSLGYNDKQVEKALARVGQTVDNKATVEEWIKKALQVI
jgi:Holliday junction DNA helicase RuvA